MMVSFTFDSFLPLNIDVVLDVIGLLKGRLSLTKQGQDSLALISLCSAFPCKRIWTQYRGYVEYVAVQSVWPKL